MYILILLFVLADVCTVLPLCGSNERKISALNEILNNNHWRTSTKDIGFRELKCVSSKSGAFCSSTEIVTRDALLPNVNATNIQQKLKYCSLVLSVIYSEALSPLQKMFEAIENSYQENGNDQDRTEAFKDFVKSIRVFSPLLSCMTKALKFFENKTAVLVTLKKLNDWYKSISKKPYESFEYDISNKYFQKALKLNIFDEEFKTYSKKYTSSRKRDNTIITGFLKSVSDPNDGSFNPDRLNLDKNIEDGVELFCENFGFEDKEKSLIKNRASMNDQ